MSALLMGRAFYVPLDISSKLVLLALCDHATDEGVGSRPGLRRLEVKASLDRRSVQRALKHLERHDLIQSTGYRRGGRGHATNWTINVGACRIWSDRFEADPEGFLTLLANSVTESPFTELNSDTKCPKGCHLRQETVTPESPQPSGTINKPVDVSNPEAERQPGESNRAYRKRLLDRIGKTIG